MIYSCDKMLDMIEANDKKLKVGDKMRFTLLTGEKVVGEIMGFNHDTIAGTKKKAFASFRFTIDGEFEMNEEWTNIGGWTKCKMRKAYCERVFKLLPIRLQKAIQTVIKETAKGGGSCEIARTKDKLFLLSVTETTGDHYWSSYVKEGEQYELFKKKGYSFDKWSWLRSPNTSSTSNFWYVDSSGSTYTYFADYTYGVCFAFAIGKSK